jgi:hypothetical protein
MLSCSCQGQKHTQDHEDILLKPRWGWEVNWPIKEYPLELSEKSCDLSRGDGYIMKWAYCTIDYKTKRKHATGQMIVNGFIRIADGLGAEKDP